MARPRVDTRQDPEARGADAHTHTHPDRTALMRTGTAVDEVTVYYITIAKKVEAK
jgi:hypothetical protein